MQFANQQFLTTNYSDFLISYPVCVIVLSLSSDATQLEILRDFGPTTPVIVNDTKILRIVEDTFLCPESQDFFSGGG